MNDDFERITGSVPGAQTRALGVPLREHESRNVTYIDENFPVFWASASGATVEDVDGNRYLDLTSAFGVASVGHSNPAVASAIASQAATLMHGMGDVHPTAIRTRLLERLARIMPAGLRKTYLATTGAEAVEAALKTAVLATGKSRFLSFNGAYHGLSIGALEVGGIEKFIAPFAGLVPDVSVRVDYPDAQKMDARTALDVFARAANQHDDLAAVIMEPIQGRGGCIVPPGGYLRGVRDYCTARGMLLIFDEIYTGFGRTGHWFACEHERVTPDIMCVGKAMGGGFPISAAVASEAVMDAWPASAGEALHTSTYLGNPMGCAAALATIDELERRALPAQARELGSLIERRLNALRGAGKALAIRGRGCMWGIQLRDAAGAGRAVNTALQRGVLLLQAGPAGDVLSITPPLVMSPHQLYRAFDILEEIL